MENNKICVNKSFIFIFFVIMGIAAFVIATSQLTKKSSSTNTRASENSSAAPLIGMSFAPVSDGDFIPVKRVLSGGCYGDVNNDGKTDDTDIALISQNVGVNNSSYKLAVGPTVSGVVSAYDKLYVQADKGCESTKLPTITRRIDICAADTFAFAQIANYPVEKWSDYDEQYDLEKLQNTSTKIISGSYNPNYRNVLLVGVESPSNVSWKNDTQSFITDMEKYANIMNAYYQDHSLRIRFSYLNTPLTMGISRQQRLVYLTDDNNAIKQLENINSNKSQTYETIVYLMDTFEYGGSGGKFPVFTIDPEFSFGLMIHETNHSFGYFSDAYLYRRLTSDLIKNYETEYYTDTVIPNTFYSVFSKKVIPRFDTGFRCGNEILYGLGSFNQKNIMLDIKSYFVNSVIQDYLSKQQKILTPYQEIFFQISNPSQKPPIQRRANMMIME